MPEEALPSFYNIADLFVFPSLYEGFGLPTLEAMGCGTPVVTSNQSSLPEVVGDAAIIVDPYDVEAIADGMMRIRQGAGSLTARKGAGACQIVLMGTYRKRNAGSV